VRGHKGASSCSGKDSTPESYEDLRLKVRNTDAYKWNDVLSVIACVPTSTLLLEYSPETSALSPHAQQTRAHGVSNGLPGAEVKRMR
jgi:hypothetical protein